MTLQEFLYLALRNANQRLDPHRLYKAVSWVRWATGRRPQRRR